MNDQQKKPIILRDGALKATIWKNTSEKGDFYSVDLARTYTVKATTPEGKDEYADTNSFSGSQLLQIARLAHKAYDHIAKLRAQEKAANETA